MMKKEGGFSSGRAGPRQTGGGPPMAELNVCWACNESRDSPTAIDVGPRRAWAHDQAKPMCAWCANLEALRPTFRRVPELASIAPSTAEWALLLSSMVALKLEGAVVAATTLAAKYSLFKKVFNLQALRAPAEPASAAASSSCGARPSPAKSPAPKADPDSFVTPRKEKHIKCKSESARSSTHPTEAASEGGSVAASSAQSPALASRPSVKSEEEADPMEEESSEDEATDPALDIAQHEPGPSDMVRLSVEGRFPTTSLGPAIGRSRDTINSYVRTLSEFGWVAKYKPATIRALCGRLVKHRSDVDKSANLEMIEGFQALVRRIRRYIALFKAIVSWKTTGEENKLLAVLGYMDALAPVLRHFGLQFAGDLAIVEMRARFHASFRKSGAVHQARLWFGATCAYHWRSRVVQADSRND